MDTPGPLPRPAAVVLNGGSSCGKTTLSVALQRALPEPWLRLGVDTLIEAMPPEGGPAGVSFGADGTVSVGPGFRTLEEHWAQGVAAIARAGTGVIVDEVMLGGPASQARWAAALDGLPVLWVGVRCDLAEAERREAARGDRITGMARQQAEVVHRGVRYHLVVDTTTATPDQTAAVVARRMAEGVGPLPAEGSAAGAEAVDGAGAAVTRSENDGAGSARVRAR